MTTQVLNPQVSDKQLSLYADMIYDVTGIRIAPQKKALLSNRLRRRLKATGIEDFGAYYNHLKKVSKQDPEWDCFLQEITTHETYLFRDELHWKWLRDEYFPQLGSEAKAGKRQKQLRVWSAACSTGAEAYSVATCVVDSLPNHADWKVEIFGSDIGVGAVEEARQADFGERDMRLVPDNLQRRCFQQKPGEKLWNPKDLLRKMTRFEQHNLLHSLKQRPFDLVILKNVLIYFDIDSKAKVVKHILDAMKPGSMLIAGAAEGISGMLNSLTRQRPWLFQKP